MIDKLEAKKHFRDELSRISKDLALVYTHNDVDWYQWGLLMRAIERVITQEGFYE